MLKLQAAEQTLAMPAVESYKPIATSVIHIYLPGGMAQHESWDPKPFASPDYRGPYTPIKTSLPGEYVGEKFVNIAKIMNKLTVVRSMTHGEAAHERGTHNMFTGYRPSPALTFPSMGSVVSHEMGPRKNLPPYVCIPGQPNEFAGTGYLSSSFAPFSLGSDPAANGFTANSLQGGAVDTAQVHTGDLDLRLATLQTTRGGDIRLLGPGGDVIAGFVFLAGTGESSGVNAQTAGSLHERSVRLRAAGINAQRDGGRGRRSQRHRHDYHGGAGDCLQCQAGGTRSCRCCAQCALPGCRAVFPWYFP